MDRKRLLRPWLHAVYTVNDFAAMIAVTVAVETLLTAGLWVIEHPLGVELPKGTHWVLGTICAVLIVCGYAMYSLNHLKSVHKPDDEPE